jgi:hypothetical protein
MSNTRYLAEYLSHAVDIEAPSGVLTFTADAPMVTVGAVDIQAPTGILTWTADGPTLSVANIQAPVGVLTYTADGPTISIQDAGTFTISGGGDLEFGGGKAVGRTFFLTGAGTFRFQGNQLTPTPTVKPLYVVTTENRDGSSVAELPVYGLELGYILDDSYTASFSIPNHQGVQEASIVPIQRIVRVYRDDEEVWSGPIQAYDADISQGIQVYAAGWFEELKKRIIEVPDVLTYDHIDMWLVMQDLIDYANDQRGFAGGPITFGTGGRGGGHMITREYACWEQRSIAEILSQIAMDAHRNFDFDVDSDKVWRTYNRPGEVNDSVLFDASVIEGLRYSRSGEETANAALSVGGGDGETSLFHYAEDTSTLNLWDLRQTTWAVPEYSRQKDVTSSAEHLVDDRSHVAIQPELEIVSSEFGFGDFPLAQNYQIEYDDGFFHIDDYFYLIKRAVGWQDSGREKTGLFFLVKNWQTHG